MRRPADLEALSFADFRQAMRRELVAAFGAEQVAPFFGGQTAKVVVVGQAPGGTSVQLRPWSNASGKTLRERWLQLSEAEFYDPENIYLTAIGMYFPGKDARGNDCKPDSALAEVWLRQELTYLRPQLYLVVGRMAADFFFPRRDFAELVGANQTINDVPALVLPHPSPLNAKWLKDHPEFSEERLPALRTALREALLL
ncbi:MAG TPA: uracil-DNA glycosylase family protein [Candidatus Saccharimonadia bacterium]|nr:uracil-DNA glycosylase family protein [Candidatus Saccharimonadia bacterium]